MRERSRSVHDQGMRPDTPTRLATSTDAVDHRDHFGRPTNPPPHHPAIPHSPTHSLSRSRTHHHRTQHRDHYCNQHPTAPHRTHNTTQPNYERPTFLTLFRTASHVLASPVQLVSCVGVVAVSLS